VDYSIGLYDSIKHGNAPIDNITARVSGWRHSIRRIGGYWVASCDYTGSREMLDDFFLNNLMGEMRFSAGGTQCWQGFIGAMSYVRDGVLWVRTMSDRANKIKNIYSRIGDNLLTNGSAESGAWAVATGAGTTGIATVTQDTTWVTDGNYSCKIVVATAVIAGADIQASVTIVASKAYMARVSLNVISGSWRVSINKTATDESLASYSTAGNLGNLNADLNIPDTNIYAGTVRFRITSEASAGTIYADAAVFQTAPERAETDWKIDANSVTEFGTLERVGLKAGMSNAAANADAQTALVDSAWPRTVPPNEYSIGGSSAVDKLSLSLFGYAFTLKWRYSTVVGTAASSTLIRSMITQQPDYLAAGMIDVNSTSYYIDNRAPLSLWTIASQIAIAGDTAGNRWQMGAYNGRKLNYSQITTDLTYKMRHGTLYNPGGGVYEPWLALPGWALIEDAPMTTSSITSNRTNDPRYVYIDEVEYIASKDNYDQAALRFRRQVNDYA
jgi:hypothetical protein